MSLTVERYNELKELYGQLKEKLLTVDEKYSLTTVEPKLDMPPSLNLQKLEFTPKTEEELRSLAEMEVAPAILSKQRSIEQSYNAQMKKFSLERTDIISDMNKRCQAVTAECEEEKAQIMRKVVSHGLVFSNVANKYTELATQRCKDRIVAEKQLFDAEQERLTWRETDAEELYNQNCAALEEEKAARTEVAYRKLCDSEQKDRVSVEKYNNSLEEKEQKYQASRAKAYESALRAAQDRALDNAKIYSELGETGYNNLIQREKYILCKDALLPLRREEARTIINIDSFLLNSLGDYYYTLSDWINATLLP